MQYDLLEMTVSRGQDPELTRISHAYVAKDDDLLPTYDNLLDALSDGWKVVSVDVTRWDGYRFTQTFWLQRERGQVVYWPEESDDDQNR